MTQCWGLALALQLLPGGGQNDARSPAEEGLTSLSVGAVLGSGFRNCNVSILFFFFCFFKKVMQTLQLINVHWIYKGGAGFGMSPGACSHETAF